MAQHDLGDKTVREILEKSMTPEAAGRVIQKINDAYKQGKSGEELYQYFKDAVEQEGKKITSDESDILYGFLAPAGII